MTKLKAILKRIYYYLQLLDGVWSVPLMFIIFCFSGIILQLFFGFGTGIYDPSFIQPLFLAATIVIGATNIAVMGMYFTFRGIYRYIYGQKKDGVRLNYSKKDWTKLKEYQRFVVAFSVFFYFVTATIGVYLKLV